MKITKTQLRRIIKEEKAKLLSELTPGELGVASAGGGTPADQGFAAAAQDDYNQSAFLEHEYFDLEDVVVVPVRELIRKGYSKEEVVEALTLIVQGAL